jgi:hypothetical protein
VRRPRSVALVAACVVVVGALSFLVGLTASALDGCCGSPEGGDSAYAVYGLVVGVASAVAGLLLWLGGTSRWPVLGLTAFVPVACVVASWSSVDLAAAAPFAVVGWLLLAWFVSRGSAAAWLGATRRVDDAPRAR